MKGNEAISELKLRHGIRRLHSSLKSMMTRVPGADSVIEGLSSVLSPDLDAGESEQDKQAPGHGSTGEGLQHDDDVDDLHRSVEEPGPPSEQD